MAREPQQTSRMKFASIGQPRIRKIRVNRIGCTATINVAISLRNPRLCLVKGRAAWALCRSCVTLPLPTCVSWPNASVKILAAAAVPNDLNRCGYYYTGVAALTLVRAVYSESALARAGKSGYGRDYGCLWRIEIARGDRDACRAGERAKSSRRAVRLLGNNGCCPLGRKLPELRERSLSFLFSLSLSLSVFRCWAAIVNFTFTGRKFSVLWKKAFPLFQLALARALARVF